MNQLTPVLASEEMDSSNWKRGPIEDPYALNDNRNFRTVNNDIEHDLHKEKNIHCSICQSVSCGHGTIYPKTCSQCKKENRLNQDVDRAVEEHAMK